MGLAGRRKVHEKFGGKHFSNFKFNSPARLGEKTSLVGHQMKIKVNLTSSIVHGDGDKGRVQ